MGQPAPALKPVPLTGPERIAVEYLKANGSDPYRAPVAVISDALADLCEAERRTMQRDRLISYGYVRGRIGVGA